MEIYYWLSIVIRSCVKTNEEQTVTAELLYVQGFAFPVASLGARREASPLGYSLARSAKLLKVS